MERQWNIARSDQIEYRKQVPANFMPRANYEEKKLKNGKTGNVKSKAILKQKIIITFSHKMLEYQRYIRSRQVECTKK